MECGMKRSNFFFLWEEKLQGDGLGVLLISQQIMIFNDIIRSAQIKISIILYWHSLTNHNTTKIRIQSEQPLIVQNQLELNRSLLNFLPRIAQNEVTNPIFIKTHPEEHSFSHINCSKCRLCRIYYNMNMCQHGQKITKFCITQHCHHKQSAGCEYCIRKYHFHLANTLILTEPDLDNLIKNITLPTDIKYKSRTLQQSAIEYLRNIKLSFNNWIDQAQNTIADRLGHPTLRKHNLLSTYNRLKHKEYRKINAKDLRLINQFSKSVTTETLKKEEIANYYEQVEWTANLLEAIEKVVADLTKLPEVKQGEGTIQVISKAKLNQIYESIRKEKEKRDIQSKTTGIQSISTTQGLKLEDNSLLKRRQSSEKNQANNNTSANQVKAIVESKNSEKLPDEAEKPAFLAQRQNSAKQSSLTYSNNNNNDNTEETKKVLRRRRSSIDDKMELKFGNLPEDKCKQDKDIDQKKKRIIERIGQQKQKQRSQSQQKVEARKGMGRQASIKVRQDDNIVGNLLNLKYANKKEQTKKQQPLLTQTSKQTTNVDKSQNTDIEKSQVSSNKASDRNVLGMMELLINNILPPLPLSAPKNTNEETITEKVVKIPIPAMNQVADQIQSPIFKTRKRQQDKDKDRDRDKQGSQSIPFGIILMPATDKAVEKVNEALLKPIPQTQPVQQASFPAIVKVSSKQNEQPQPKPSQKVQEKEDELIVLEKNQKNSLLLFSQALKSPGERAIELLKAALKYSSQNLSAAQYLSYLYLEGGKAKECIEVCQSILVKIQDTPEQFQLTLHLHNNKAAALNLLGRYSESIMILEKCLRFRRKHYFYKNLGDAYFSLGITQKAAMNYEKAIKLDPQSDEAFYNLAVTQYIQEEYTSAQLNIKQALKIQPMNQTYIQFSQQLDKRLSNLVM